MHFTGRRFDGVVEREVGIRLMFCVTSCTCTSCNPKSSILSSRFQFETSIANGSILCFKVSDCCGVDLVCSATDGELTQEPIVQVVLPRGVARVGVC